MVSEPGGRGEGDVIVIPFEEDEVTYDLEIGKWLLELA